ncbi:hypothetical protein Rhal01_01475 [Rubritalea halochordaticola]|uniref:Uncharacterized protein n=1 Tax=Rubritalea halochordaticola TaxID=714537 RepID=A0ABP9UY19_9BACT
MVFFRPVKAGIIGDGDFTFVAEEGVELTDDDPRVKGVDGLEDVVVIPVDIHREDSEVFLKA